MTCFLNFSTQGTNKGETNIYYQTSDGGEINTLQKEKLNPIYQLNGPNESIYSDTQSYPPSKQSQVKAEYTYIDPHKSKDNPIYQRESLYTLPNEQNFQTDILYAPLDAATMQAGNNEIYTNMANKNNSLDEENEI